MFGKSEHTHERKDEGTYMMNKTMTKESHEERTADEPRNMTLNDVILVKVTTVGSLVRLLRLQIPSGQPDIQFLPGQWIDCFVPGIIKAGGFTITSTPSKAVARPDSTSKDRYIDLAVKASPENPAAAWLWQDPVSTILGQPLRIRTGGSFVFPPPGVDLKAPSPDRHPIRIVFVAGGVGINPLISMVSHLGELYVKDATATTGLDVVFLYSVREEPATVRIDSADDGLDDVGNRILFLGDLASLFSNGSIKGQLQLFITGGGSKDTEDTGVLSCKEGDVPFKRRRITTADVDAAVKGGEGGADHVYVYVCGVPAMTDDFVAHLTGSKDSGGLSLGAHQVLYEKWW